MKKLIEIRHVPTALTVLCVGMSPVLAQIVPDPSAPAAQRPDVRARVGGAEMVLIQTPDAAGLSHNRYKQFDVGSRGAILNNSTASNPNLRQGAAKTILNEVNSVHPARLAGRIEVAGSRADVIVASPSGLHIDGASFVNAGNLMLSTGYSRGGRIEVGKGGLNARGADSTELHGRVVSIAGRMDGGRVLRVITGSLDGDPSTRPGLAITTHATGSMYADMVVLVTTESGTGVNLQGQVLTEKSIQIQADGLITVNRGSVSSKTELTVQAGGAVVLEQAALKGSSVALVSRQGIKANGGSIVAESLHIETGSPFSQGSADISLESSNLVVGRDTVIMASGDLHLHGRLQSRQGNIHLQSGRNLSWSAERQAPLLQGQNISVLADGGIVGRGDDLIHLKAVKSLSLQGGHLSLRGAHLEAGAALSLVATAQGVDVQSRGGRRTTLRATDDLFISASKGSIVLRGSDVFARNIQFLSQDMLQVRSSSLRATGGGIRLDSLTSRIEMDEGVVQLKADKALQLRSRQNQELRNVVASSEAALSLVSEAGSIKSSAGNFSSSDVLSFHSSGLQIHAGGQYKGGAIALHSETAHLDLSASRFDSLRINRGPSRQLSGKLSLHAKDEIRVDAGTFFTAGTDLSLIAGRGNITVQPLGIGGSGLLLQPSQLKAGRDLTLMTRQGVLSLVAQVRGQGLTPHSVSLTTQGQMVLGGHSVNIQASKLQSLQDMEIVAFGGSVLIDGVKTTLSSYVPWRKVRELQDARTMLQAEIDAITGSAEYVASEKELKKLEYQRAELCYMLLNRGACNLLQHQIQPLLDKMTREVNPLRDQVRKLDGDIQLINHAARGHENSGASLSGSNIRIRAAEGVSISGASIVASNQVDIEAAGRLPEVVAGWSDGIRIDGFSDFYEYGDSGSSRYAWAVLGSPSVIEGGSGVSLRAAALGSRLVLSETELRSSRGQVVLESGADMVLEAGQDEFYSYSTRSYKRGKWYKRKRVTETHSAKNSDAAPAILTGGNLSLKSGGTISAYATAFSAPKGHIQITAGRGLYLYAVDQERLYEKKVQKKKSFLGIKVGSSKSVSTRQSSTPLPSKLVAGSASTSSGWNTLLQGTIFQTDLSGAHIRVGVGAQARPDARIILEGIKSSVNQRQWRSGEYVLWASQTDAGSITETLTLPRFLSPFTPVFSGPVVAQLPAGDFRTQIQTLSQTPGNDYLKALASRSDVQWQPVRLAFESWNYRQEGLTASGAALLAVVVAAATQGTGASLLGTTGPTSSAIASASVSSLAAQASIALVSNGGDIGRTLRALGRSETVKAMLVSAVTAGALEQVGSMSSMQALKGSQAFSDKLTHSLVSSAARAMSSAALTGANFADTLKAALVGGLVDTVQGSASGYIKGLESEYLVHKLAHALTGCAAGAAATGSCRDGAIGAAIGEVVAELFEHERPGIHATQKERDSYRNKVMAYSKVAAGAVAAYVGGNAQTAITTAEIAVGNNYLTDQQWTEFGRKLAACKGNAGCEGRAYDSYLALSTQQDALLGMCSTRRDCDLYRAPVFDGATAMLALVREGKLPAAYAGKLDMQLHAQRLLTDKRYQRQVATGVEYMEFCRADRSACKQDQLRKAFGISGLVVAPLLAANPQLLSAATTVFVQRQRRAGAAAIGGAFNVSAQLVSNNDLDVWEVARAVLLTYGTVGASLPLTAGTYAATEVMVAGWQRKSWDEILIKGVSSGISSAIGHEVGRWTWRVSSEAFRTPYRMLYAQKPTGFLTIEGPYKANLWPGWGAAAANSWATENTYRSLIDFFIK